MSHLYWTTFIPSKNGFCFFRSITETYLYAQGAVCFHIFILYMRRKFGKIQFSHCAGGRWITMTSQLKTGKRKHTWFNYINLIWCVFHYQNCHDNIMVGGNWSVPRDKPTVIFRMMADVCLWQERIPTWPGLELSVTGFLLWEAPGPLRCTSVLTDWDT